MAPLKLDDLLNFYKSKELPSCPTNLNQNVWREIRLRKNTSVSTALSLGEFLAWFRGSVRSLVVPMLALAIVLSVGLTVLNAETKPHQRVQRALGLDVFSHQASPLTRFAENP